MDQLIQDLKFGAKLLWKDRGFALTAILTLALCIGANTTIFSVVNSVILQPLPVPEPERLVRMWNAYPNAVAATAVRGSNGAPDYFDRRELTEVFEEVATYDDLGASIELEGMPQRITAMEATPSFFRILQADAELGRTFTEEEGEWGNHRVVVLSHGLWQQMYGGDPSAIGDTMRIDGEPYTVVGVMPEGFRFLQEGARMWLALAFTEQQKQAFHSNSWDMIARLQPGTTLEQAQARVDALNARNMDRMPQLKPLLLDAGFHTPVVSLQEDLVADVRGTLYMLWGGVAFVLLIGCVNLANLVLVRYTARTPELATRFALGADRARVVRQLVTETVLLTLVGAGLGLGVAYGGLEILGTLGIEQLPRADSVRIDLVAVGYTVALALAVGVLLALIPVGNVLRLGLGAVFREEGRSGTVGRGVRALRKGMVVAQVAFALVLLVGAGLLLASFRQLLAVDPGFDPDDLLTGSVVLSESRYEGSEEIDAFARQALRRIRELPGVVEAGVTSQIPFGGGFSDSVIFAEGYEMKPGESAISPSQVVVTPGYFEAMRIPLAAGRTFDERDVADSQPAIVIDRRLAERFWPDGDALGKRMWRPTSVEDITDPANREFFTIVGIVEPIQERDLVGGLERNGMYYFPLSQQARRGLDLAIRTSGEPGAMIGPVRRVIAELDPQLPLFSVATMENRISSSLTDRRTPMVLTVVFAAVALLLAAVGIYGVFAYLVALRTREIGIRMALGSDARGISGLVLKEGVVTLAAGLALGLAGAVALARTIESQLYGVRPLDPVVLAAVAGLLALVALTACVIPARRATRVDPVAALTQGSA